MKPEIRVDSAAAEELDGQPFCVLQCTVLSRVVQKGQNIVLPMNSSFDVYIPIDEIENRPDQNGQITIKMRCEDMEEAEFVCALNFVDEILLVDPECT